MIAARASCSGKQDGLTTRRLGAVSKLAKAALDMFPEPALTAVKGHIKDGTRRKRTGVASTNMLVALMMRLMIAVMVLKIGAMHGPPKRKVGVAGMTAVDVNMIVALTSRTGKLAGPRVKRYGVVTMWVLVAKGDVPIGVSQSPKSERRRSTRRCSRPQLQLFFVFCR